MTSLSLTYGWLKVGAALRRGCAMGNQVCLSSFGEQTP